jgi:hypothetical protein
MFHPAILHTTIEVITTFGVDTDHHAIATTRHEHDLTNDEVPINMATVPKS